MPQYLSPGVYVEEVPSGIKPIAGVGTSTAGFIGAMPNEITVPDGVPVVNEEIATADGNTSRFDLDNYPVKLEPDTFQIRVNGRPVPATLEPVTLENDDANEVSQVVFAENPAEDSDITGDYLTETFTPVVANKPKLCTNFSQFKSHFGDFFTPRTRGKGNWSTLCTASSTTAARAAGSPAPRPMKAAIQTPPTAT